MFFRSGKKDSTKSPSPSGDPGRAPAKADGPPPLPLPSADSERVPAKTDRPPPLYDFPDQQLSENEIDGQLRPPLQPSGPAFGPEKQLQASFGQIVALLSRVPSFQSLPLSVLRTAVMPGISTGQFLIAEGKNQKTGRAGPLAALLWANVSPQVDELIVRDRGQILQLSEADWKGGDIVWVTLAVGEQRLVRRMLERLRATTFKGRPIKLYPTGAEGPVTLDPR